jgi:hypothetical protein
VAAEVAIKPEEKTDVHAVIVRDEAVKDVSIVTMLTRRTVCGKKY